MAKSDLEMVAEWAAKASGAPKPTRQELDELSASWDETYNADQAARAGLTSEQHRRAAEDRERLRREAAGS